VTGAVDCKAYVEKKIHIYDLAFNIKNNIFASRDIYEQTRCNALEVCAS
jgi:hypothetical protein